MLIFLGNMERARPQRDLHAARGRFTLEGGGAEAPVEGLASPGEAAAFVFLHPGTGQEVRTLCGDLQVLGRSEFKQLLKWCAARSGSHPSSPPRLRLCVLASQLVTWEPWRA